MSASITAASLSAVFGDVWGILLRAGVSLPLLPLRLGMAGVYFCEQVYRSLFSLQRMQMDGWCVFLRPGVSLPLSLPRERGRAGVGASHNLAMT